MNIKEKFLVLVILASVRGRLKELLPLDARSQAFHHASGFRVTSATKMKLELIILFT